MYERSEPLRVLREAEAEDQSARGIAIFGAPRGGTSMVAGALRILGADLGERQGVGNNEDLDLLDARGPVHAIEDGAAFGVMRDYLARRTQSDHVWGWKDPHAALYIDQVIDILPRPRLLAVFRDPAACAERIGLLTGQDRLNALENTLRLYGRAGLMLDMLDAPSAIISYEKALVRPKRFLLELARFVGLSPQREQFEQALDFISPERGHGNPDTLGWPREGSL